MINLLIHGISKHVCFGNWIRLRFVYHGNFFQHLLCPNRGGGWGRAGSIQNENERSLMKPILIYQSHFLKGLG